MLQLQGQLDDARAQLTSLQAELAARADQSRSREEELRASLMESEQTVQALTAKLASSREDVESKTRELQQEVSVARPPRCLHTPWCRSKSVITQDAHLVGLETTARATGGPRGEV